MFFNKLNMDNEYIQEKLNHIKEEALNAEENFKSILDEVHPKNRKSALNLLHYIIFRQQITEEVQHELSAQGISSLQHAESHVVANLQVVLRILHQLKGKEYKGESTPVSIMEGKEIIDRNRKMIFGSNPDGRSIHIMVTFPSDAATNYDLVKGMMESGMTCARINCAKDDASAWHAMIDNIHKAEGETGKSCKVLMDLGGPKIRTGDIKKGPNVVKAKPQYGLKGETIKPVSVRFSAKDKKKLKEDIVVPVDERWLSEVREGDKVYLQDGRDHDREIEIKETDKDGAIGDAEKLTFFDENTKLRLKRDGAEISSTQVGKIPPTKQYIFLQQGDILYLHKDDREGEPAEFNDDGELLRAPHIGCTLPEIFKDIEKDDPIMFDDGKIRGVVKEVSEDELMVEITYAKNDRRALKPDKGINLPASYPSVSGLTKKDISDLDFIVKHADIVNLSFLRHPSDILHFIDELRKRKAEELGVMMKIETQRAVEKLPWLVLHAMKHYPVSIMIARGDLAIETGWEEMAVLQDEILWLCEAAHTPVVWATQVLEGMAKKGLPKRAEISDAVMAQKADCVMLNKGNYIRETIKMLDDILKKLEKQKMKSSTLVQELNFNDAFVD